jgi:hypothetical protein
MEGQGIGACSLVRNTLGVEGRAGAPRRSKKIEKRSFTHMDLHKPNKELVSA